MPPSSLHHRRRATYGFWFCLAGPKRRKSRHPVSRAAAFESAAAILAGARIAVTSRRLAGAGVALAAGLFDLVHVLSPLTQKR